MRTFNLIVALLVVTYGCGSCGENNTGQPSDVGNGGDDMTADAGDASVPEEDAGRDATTTDMVEEEDVAPDAAEDLGPDMSEPPGYQDPTGASGTRLKRRYVEGGPGAYMTVGFWDTELDVACEFGEAVDGTMRCLPPTDFVTWIQYADADCTEPVYVAREHNCDLGWSEDPYSGRFYRRTDDPAVLNGQLYYATSYSGECQEAVLDDQLDYFVAEYAPASQFVKGTFDTEPRADGLVARYLDGEDGSRVLHDTVHQTRGYTCDFEETGHCVPSGPIPSLTAYEDPSCTRPVHGYRENEDPVLIIDPDYEQPQCDREFTYYERGDEVTTDVLFRLDNVGNCVDQNLGGLWTFYRPGAEIPLSDLPEASIELEGTGDLPARRYVDSDGAPLGSAHEFWDATRDEPCNPMMLEGGDFICLTEDSHRIDPSAYSDAACTEGNELVASRCDAPPARVAWDRLKGNSCVLPDVPVMASAHETGASVGDSYYYNAPRTDQCEMRQVPDILTYYEVGAEVTEFPPLQVGTEGDE